MKRVLVVDDAPTVRMYHREILESLGLAVDEAYNGVEALEKALTQPYDLYVVDINMPEMDGYRFLRALRQQPEFPQRPAIMVSTEAADIDRVQAFQAGANLYLVKPVKPEVLRQYVQLLLGEKPS
ncbi:MAG: response regulator [Rhodothermus sp.]|nr:response regulator [Rhodothermus sp.]